MSISKIVLEYTYDMPLYCLGLLYTTTEEWGSCNKDSMAHKTKYSLSALYRKSLPTHEIVPHLDSAA